MNLNLFTANYPTGFGESFISNEIKFLKNEFDEIQIFPFKSLDEPNQILDSNISLINHSAFSDQISMSSYDYFKVIAVWIKEFINVKGKFFYLSRSRHFLSSIIQAYKVSKWIERQSIDVNDVYYSFWMNEWALALAILKYRTGNPKFIFRVNGFDIYDERHEGNYLPFRNFIYQQAEAIIPLSKTAELYIKGKTRYKDKVKMSYFGTVDNGAANNDKKDLFTVMTCSSAIPLKRLDKIAQVLSLLDFEVKWIHHGNGETVKDVELILGETGKNIEFKCTDKVKDYKEVLKIQQELAPDLFINLSSTEGLPVTLIEALSFGTPLLVNDVGSCAELINDYTGILVAVDESPKNIAKKITEFRESKDLYPKYKIREFWKSYFCAETNYKNFALELKQIFK